MAVIANFELHPRTVARPLQALQHWRLPDAGDELALRAGVLNALRAMQSLTALEVPIEMNARRAADDPGFGDGAALHALLSEAEKTLRGAPHRSRIARVRDAAPAHAERLEQARRAAVEHMRVLKRRVDFVRAGLDALEEPVFIRQRAERTRVFQ